MDKEAMVHVFTILRIILFLNFFVVQFLVKLWYNFKHNKKGINSFRGWRCHKNVLRFLVPKWPFYPVRQESVKS